MNQDDGYINRHVPFQLFTYLIFFLTKILGKTDVNDASDQSIDWVDFSIILQTAPHSYPLTHEARLVQLRQVWDPIIQKCINPVRNKPSFLSQLTEAHCLTNPMSTMPLCLPDLNCTFPNLHLNLNGDYKLVNTS